MKNHDKTNEYRKHYIENRNQIDVNFQLIRNTRRRIHHALNGKLKSSTTLDILGIGIDIYRKWIAFQTTPQKNWDNIEIDHVKPVSLFNVSNNAELKEAFNLKNIKPLPKQDHQH